MKQEVFRFKQSPGKVTGLVLCSALYVHVLTYLESVWPLTVRNMIYQIGIFNVNHVYCLLVDRPLMMGRKLKLEWVI